jgi:hypothetical protein
MIVPLGLALFSTISLHGQIRPDPVSFGPGLTVSFATNIAPSCRTAIISPRPAYDVESELRSAGIKVSRAYNAALTREADCIPLGALSPKTSIVVHQCLALREVVSLSSQARGVQMAVTWQKCESLTCPHWTCDAKAGRSFGNLLEAFLTVVRRRDPDSHPSYRSEFVNPVKPEQAKRAPSPKLTSLQIDTPTVPSRTTVTTFYVAYILTCLALLVYWEFRRVRFSGLS